MIKIASPQDLQAELRSLMAFVHDHGPEGRPDREVVAAKLRDLADRVAKTSVSPSSIKNALKSEMFRLDRADQKRMRRGAEVAPGITVTEFKGVVVRKRRLVPTGPSSWEVKAYTGVPGRRWEVSGELGTIQEAVDWARKREESSKEAWESDS